MSLPPEAAPHCRYHILHETRYRYQGVVTLSQQVLHLTPRDFAHQRTESHRIHIEPAVDECSERSDYFGNLVRHVGISAPHQSLLVRSEAVVAMLARPGPEVLAASPPWESLRDLVQHSSDPALLEACRYLYESPQVRWNGEIAQFARASFKPGRALLQAAMELAVRIGAEFEFDPQATDISTPLEQVMAGRRGVCQDFAQLMVGCLRSLGLPARYVSGYILTHPPEGQPRLVGADASHAWVSVYCPQAGWIDFDPTNRCLVQYEHLTLGWGRDFSDVTPLRGVVLGGGCQQLQVNVTMTPLDGRQSARPAPPMVASQVQVQGVHRPGA
ncbi:transglutaminase N-terminal domain-containing protein [Oxalobacteraceae bacterium A2-2]